MFRAWILAAVFCTSLTLTSIAEEEEKKPDSPPPTRRGQLTEEQKAVRKEMVGKYDKNKDGKLDAEERKAITAEDKEKLSKARLGPATPRKKKDAPK